MATGTGRILGWVAAGWAAVFLAGTSFRVLADCSAFGLPFTDLGSTTFCAQIAEAYYSGLTNGTSATAYSPSANVNREQMAAFVTRTLDQSLLRGNRRSALDQWWTQTPRYDAYGSPGLTTVGLSPEFLKSDGTDIWVANPSNDSVSRVRASDGKKLEDWTGATWAYGVLVAMGRVFVTGYLPPPGRLYMIDPSGTAGPVTTVASNLGDNPYSIAFDGSRLWTANYSGSVSIVTPGATLPWSVTPKPLASTALQGIVFDGANMWVTDANGGTLLELDSDANIVKTVTVGSFPSFPAFDGHNIWVPNRNSNSVTVVRTIDGTVLKTFSTANGNANGLSKPTQAAFDGQRILVTNYDGGLSLFKATDLSVIGNLPTTGVDNPFGVCSDGINFWVSFIGSGNIGRF